LKHGDTLGPCGGDRGVDDGDKGFKRGADEDDDSPLSATPGGGQGGQPVSPDEVRELLEALPASECGAGAAAIVPGMVAGFVAGRVRGSRRRR
jgi:hypothetical protein